MKSNAKPSMFGYFPYLEKEKGKEKEKVYKCLCQILHLCVCVCVCMSLCLNLHPWMCLIRACVRDSKSNLCLCLRLQV